MFKVCTTFDEEYFQYGYPMLCSAVNTYPASIFVLAINMRKDKIKKLQRLPKVEIIQQFIDRSFYHPDYRSYCFAAKAEALRRCLDTTSDNVALIDGDCLFQKSLDDFEAEFNAKGIDLAVHCRDLQGKEYLRFCSHYVFLRNSEHSKTFVKDWLKGIPEWDHSAFKVGKTYAEQACMWKAYDKNKDNLKLMDISSLEIPILHAKGAKYAGHPEYISMQYKAKCNAEIAKFEKSR